MIHPPPLVYYPIVPEAIIGVGAIAVLLLDALIKRDPEQTSRPWLFITLGVILASAAELQGQWNWPGHSPVLGDMVYADKFSVVAGNILLAVAFFAAIFGHHYLKQTGEQRGEFYPLLLFATLGMMLLVAAADLIVVFLALEILSLALYVLTGFSNRAASGEAAMKYFLLGAFSSAFFLYGIALAYGATGTTKITGIATALSGRVDPSALALAAAALLAVGFAFKIAAVPFHMWTPDVYEGAPTPITAFMSAATKVAAFAALIRVLDVSLQPITWNWLPAIWTLAAVTMIGGSLLAIAQSDVKRMLAYSSVAHAGFILVGLSAANGDGIQSALFYLAAYAAMILGAFGVVMLVSVKGERDTSLDAYKGLGRRNPLLAGLMSLFLLSLAGIPPTAGFIAKVAVFGAAVRAGAWPLALIAVLSSVVAAFFYIRVIVYMYMQEEAEVAPETDQTPRPAVAPAASIGVLAAVTLLLGLFPGLIFGLLHSASVISW